MGHALKDPIALFTEFTKASGAGHLIETFHLSSMLKKRGMDYLLMVTVEPSTVLPTPLPASATKIPEATIESLSILAKQAVHAGAHLALINFQNISNDQVSAIAAQGLDVICIDEFGRRELNCVAVINPSIVKAYHRYTSNHPEFHLYAGPEYLALSEEYAALHATPRHFKSTIDSIGITLGGVDRSGATLAVVRALSAWQPQIQKNIFVSNAFPHMKALLALLSQQNKSWRLHRGLPMIGQLLGQCDIGITAGGDTLYELACVGTPAIVCFEEPHEKDQGRAFQEAGFGICLARGVDVEERTLQGALQTFEKAATRKAHSDAGRRLVDGLGTKRACDILETKMMRRELT